MAVAINLVGKKFGRLTVIEKAGNRGRKTAWTCRCKCGAEKPINTYSLTSGHATSCGCVRVELLVDLAHKRKATDPIVLQQRKARYKQMNYRAYLKRKYGISHDEIAQRLVFQNNKCAICELELTIPCVDHCHITLRVRKLLCRRCNLLLGHAADNPQLLRRAATYIEESEESK